MKGRLASRSDTPGAQDAAPLQVLQERLRYIEEAVPLGLWSWDVASGAVEWSSGLSKLYGLQPGQTVRHFDEFLRFLHPDDVARAQRDAAAGIASGRPFDLEFRIVRGDGCVRWLVARAQTEPGPDGQARRVTGLNFDVTEARDSAQALKLSDATVANMTEGVVLCSARTTAIVYANPRYEAMLGYSPGELLGLPGAVVNSPAEGDPAATGRRIQEELERQGWWRGVVRNRRKDGRDIWVRATISAFEHPEHGPVWLNVIGDITEEREAQLARDQATSELNRLASRMQQSIEAERAALSRDVHDQLGAALTGMRLRLSALAGRNGVDAALQAELREIAALAQAASVQTREICSRLRPPALDDLGLVETCRWTLAEWRRGSGLAVVRRLRRLPQEPAPALAIDVFRVLQELLTNVARHAGATRVEVGLARRAPWLELRVVDDGHGFRPTAGRGLGLVGVRERAERHGGEVRVDTGPGGTAVTVRFHADGAA